MATRWWVKREEEGSHTLSLLFSLHPLCCFIVLFFSFVLCKIFSFLRLIFISFLPLLPPLLIVPFIKEVERRLMVNLNLQASQGCVPSETKDVTVTRV